MSTSIASKYNSLELAEKETSKSINLSNQIEILDYTNIKEDFQSTKSNSFDINSSNLMEQLDNNNLEKDPYRLDLSNDKLFNTNFETKDPKKIANVLVFGYFKGEPIFSVGPHYPLALCLLVSLSSVYVLMNHLVYNKISESYNLVAFVIYFIQAVSHLLTALINPGIPLRKNYLPEYIKANHVDLNKKNPDLQICRLCNIIVHKNDLVSHCEECDLCCIGHDHHCPWTSKCIGRRNLIPFYFFVFSTLVFIVFNFVSVMMYGILMTEKQSNNTNRNNI